MEICRSALVRLRMNKDSALPFQHDLRDRVLRGV